MSSEYEYENQDELIEWAQCRMRRSYPDPDFIFRDDAKAIAHVRNGKIVGVVVFDTFTDGDCFLFVVSDGSRRWLTRQFILHVLAYPFGQLGFNRITAIVSVLNEDSIRFCNNFGWKLEGVLRKKGPLGEHMFLFGMLRSECKWIENRRRLER